MPNIILCGVVYLRFYQGLIPCLHFNSLVNTRNEDCEIHMYKVKKIRDLHTLTRHG